MRCRVRDRCRFADRLPDQYSAESNRLPVLGRSILAPMSGRGAKWGAVHFMHLASAITDECTPTHSRKSYSNGAAVRGHVRRSFAPGRVDHNRSLAAGWRHSAIKGRTSSGVLSRRSSERSCRKGTIVPMHLSTGTGAVHACIWKYDVRMLVPTTQAGGQVQERRNEGTRY